MFVCFKDFFSARKLKDNKTQMNPKIVVSMKKIIGRNKKSLNSKQEQLRLETTKDGIVLIFKVFLNIFNRPLLHRHDSKTEIIAEIFVIQLGLNSLGYASIHVA